MLFAVQPAAISAYLKCDCTSLIAAYSIESKIEGEKGCIRLSCAIARTHCALSIFWIAENTADLFAWLCEQEHRHELHCCRVQEATGI